MRDRPRNFGDVIAGDHVAACARAKGALDGKSVGAIAQDQGSNVRRGFLEILDQADAVAMAESQTEDDDFRALPGKELARLRDIIGLGANAKTAKGAQQRRQTESHYRRAVNN